MLHYKQYIHKTSSEWIVFLHGAGGSSTIWTKQIRTFSKYFNLLLIDLRGHGQSAGKVAFTPRYTMKDIAIDVIEVLNHLKLGKAHFLGVSLGTIVVRHIAEINPFRVKSMVMAGAVVNLDIRSRFLMRLANSLRYMVPYMWIYRIYAYILMPRKRHRQSRNMFIHDAYKLKRGEFMRWFTITAEINPLLRYFRMNELPVPTLYVMGDEDYMFLPQVKNIMKTHTHYSQLIVVKDSGHVCNVDQADVFNQVSMEFIMKHVDTSAPETGNCRYRSDLS